jgi:hypothetical protein
MTSDSLGDGMIAELKQLATLAYLAGTCPSETLKQLRRRIEDRTVAGDPNFDLAPSPRSERVKT